MNFFVMEDLHENYKQKKTFQQVIYCGYLRCGLRFESSQNKIYGLHLLKKDTETLRSHFTAQTET